MAVSRRTDTTKATDKDEAADKGTTTKTVSTEATGGPDTAKDPALQAEGRSTSVTAPNEVKNDPGATGGKEIDPGRVAAHQDALKARDGENAKSPYTEIPAAGAAATESTTDDTKKSAGKAKTSKATGKEPEPGEGDPEQHDDGVALGTSFTHGSSDFTSTGLPVVEDAYAVEKLSEGTEFLAAFLHDPSKSDDHYAVVNSLPDLRSGKISRKAIPESYWNSTYAQRPPKARREARARGGYVVIE